jgi:hypothetical protein
MNKKDRKAGTKSRLPMQFKTSPTVREAIIEYCKDLSEQSDKLVTVSVWVDEVARRELIRVGRLQQAA